MKRVARIRVYAHPMAAQPSRVVVVPSLAEWLMDTYRTRRPGLEFHLYAGEPSAEADITRDFEAILRQDASEYVVLESPGGEPLTWTAILTSAAKLAAAAAVSYALNSVFGKDPRPLESRSQESPNNRLSDRENRVRILERVEDIFGTVRAIPSLLMPTYFKYIDHKKVEYAYYCVTRGYATLSDVRDGQTLLQDITGASAAVYWPFTSPNSGSPVLTIGDAIIDRILTVRRSIGVEGIVLKAMNQLQPQPGLAYVLRGAGSAGFQLPVTTTTDVIYQPTAAESGGTDSRRPNFAAIAASGQDVTVTMADTTVTRLHEAAFTAVSSTKTITAGIAGFFRGLVNGTSIAFPGFTDPTNQAVKTVVSHTDDTVTVAEAMVDETGLVITEATVDLVVNFSGTRTIDQVGNGYVTLTGADQLPALAELHTATITVDNDLTDWSDWFTHSDVDVTEVWTNVVARNGLFKDDGSKSSVTIAYEVQIERLNESLTPTGEVATITGEIEGTTSNERAETLEHVTGWTGPVRVRARRVTPHDYDFAGFVQDEITWLDLYAVAPVSKLHFGNKTTIHTVTRTTAGSAALPRRELNCLASRLLPTYNGSVFSGAFDATGALASGTIHATSRIADIIAAVTVDPKIGGRAITEIDLAQIWSVQQALDAWHPDVGTFNYTFDDDNISYEETVRAIADAGFCAPYRQNGKVRLALDAPQAVSAALFNHRNKRPNAETITRRFASDADYDGIEMVYMDPDTEKQETIRLPLDGSYTKLKRVEVSGIRSYPQAWFRANREYGRLRYQRILIETDVTTDARMLLPNLRVDIVDNTRFRTYDGDVVGQSGLTLTLSRDVTFTPSQPHSIVVARRDGSTQGIACTPGAAANQVVLATPPDEALVVERTAEEGERTRFWFATDSVRQAQAALVQEISFTDGGYVKLRAVNYSDAYYAADGEPVPARDSVIN